MLLLRESLKGTPVCSCDAAGDYRLLKEIKSTLTGPLFPTLGLPMLPEMEVLYEFRFYNVFAQILFHQSSEFLHSFFSPSLPLS